jgi:hypothetical protein
MTGLTPRSAHAGYPEVGEFGHAIVGQQDIRGFDVPVHDAGCVDGRERVRDLRQQVAGLRPRKWTVFGKAGPQRATGHELHDDKGSRIPGAVAANSDDVRRSDRAGQINLAREPFYEFGVARVQVAQHLDGNDLAAFVVARLPHDAHGAAPNLLDQLEALGQGV